MNFKRWIVGGTLGLMLSLAVLPLEAGHRRYRRAAFRVHSLHRPVVHFGYASPAYYGVDFVYRRGGYYGGRYGRVDFNIKPKGSEVYVDGTYLGVADDFNGGFFGSTANLPVGRHHIKVVAPDGRVYERRIYVMPGREFNFDYRF